MVTLFDLSEHTLDMIPGQPEYFAVGMKVRINGNQHKDDFRDGVVTGTDEMGIVWARFNRKRPLIATDSKTVEYPVYDPSDPKCEYHNPVVAWSKSQ